MTLLQVTWDVSPTIFKIGSFEIRWYGLLFASGFLIGHKIMARIFKLENKPEKDLDALLLTMIGLTVLGARVGHYVFYEGNHFMEAPLKFIFDMLVPPYAGLASHGAAFGIVLGLYFYVKKHPDQPYLWLTDRLVIVSALAGCCIRLGNLMNSEIVGKATNVPWAFIFVQNTEFAQVPRHASQLYEAISCLVLFIILFFIYEKYKSATPRGLLTGIFFVWIFGLRFFYEFLKENQEAFENELPINMGQILSIPLVAFGLYVFINSFRQKTSTENN